MAVWKKDEYKAPIGALWNKQGNKYGRGRFARELFTGRYQPGELLRLSNTAATYEIDEEALLNIFSECQSLGLLTLSNKKTAMVCAPNPKEMQEAYEIRAGLEEISGRTAATVFKGNAGRLRYELAAMRAALEERDLDACAEHDVRFHRAVLRASQNDVLLRVWDALAVDLRMRATIGKVTQNLPAVVDSHQPIVEALDRGQGREAGLLLRNHVETSMQFLKKADFDSGVQRAVAKDLETAKDIQNAFFPQQDISIPGLHCRTFYKPAHGIGGDYYDLFPLSDDRWGIAIGDVSGKGIGAALIMASLQASLRAQALHPHLDLPAIIGGVNHLIHESSPTGLFASLFYAEYEPASRRLQYVNAGHNPPIIVRPRTQCCELFHLRAQAVPIGMYAEVQFEATQFQLAKDDILVSYTDGITEASNTSGQLWGVERLESLLRPCCRMAPGEIVERILAEVSDFANDEAQRDDVTLVVMKVQEGCNV
ncbi:MAG: SpoIIE family protein phosphatase [Candidatus Acidiferrum sp.]|jgi:DNA-binding GntR family transcriptional regulator